MVGPWVETSNKSVPNSGLGLVMVCWSVDEQVVLSRGSLCGVVVEVEACWQTTSMLWRWYAIGFWNNHEPDVLKSVWGVGGCLVLLLAGCYMSVWWCWW